MAGPWIRYTLLRIGLFAVLLAILLVLRLDPLWATIVAAVIALCLSYVFFARQRDAAVRSLAERRAPKPTTDDLDEDALLDASGDLGGTAPAPQPDVAVPQPDAAAPAASDAPGTQRTSTPRSEPAPAQASGPAGSEEHERGPEPEPEQQRREGREL